MDRLIELDNELQSKINNIESEKIQVINEQEKKNSIKRKFIIALFVLLSITSLLLVIHMISPIIADNNTTVYITDTGSAYHSHNCTALYNSKNSISLDEARSKGYFNCSRCIITSASFTNIGIILVVALFIALIWFNVYFALDEKYLQSKIKNIENYYNKNIEKVKEFNKKQMLDIVSNNDIYAICSIPKGITFVNGLPESDEMNFYKYVTYGGKCYHETPNCSGHFLYKKHMFNCMGMAMCKKCGKQEIVIPNWFEKYRKINDITSKYDIQLEHYMKRITK